MTEERCPVCGDSGKLGWNAGEMQFCHCHAGIAAELEDRDRVLSILAEKIESAPEFDAEYRRGLWDTFNRLKGEYDQIERTYRRQEMVTA